MFEFDKWRCYTYKMLLDNTLTSEKRLNIDNKLNFDFDVSQLCRKASKKLGLYEFAKVFRYIDTKYCRYLVKFFITLQLRIAL